MLKLNIYLRFGLIAGLFVLGIVLQVAYGFWYALIFYVAALVLLAGYFLLGTVQSTSELMQAQQFAQARKRLELTKYPQLLFPTNKAYYYMLKANLALQGENTKEAEVYLKQASEIELPSGNETAVVEVQLASIAAKRGAWPEVNKRLQRIKKLTVTEPMILEQVGHLERAYRNRGNMRHMQRGGRMGAQMPGGKRRRPRMG